MKKYIKKIISGMLALSMFTSTLITSSAATDVNVSVNVNPKIDVMLTSKITNYDLSKFEEDVKENLISKGINTNNIVFQTVKREFISTDESKASEIFSSWKCFFANNNANSANGTTYYGPGNNHSDNQYSKYGSYTGKSAVASTYYTVYDNRVQMTKGSQRPAVAFYDPSSLDTQNATIKFNYGIDKTNYESFSDGEAGFIFKVQDPLNYYVYVMDNHDLCGNAGYTYREVLLKSVNGVWYYIDSKTLPAYSAGMLWNLEIVLDGNNIKIYREGDLRFEYDDNTTLGNGSLYSTGSYGFYVWNQKGAYFSNISVDSESFKTYKDVLTQPTWRDDAEHIVVNVDNKIDDTLTGDATIGEILSRTLADDIHFIQWGSDTNKTVSNNFIKQNDNKGLFTYSSNYNQAVEKTTDYIVSLINQESSEQYITIGQDISFSVDPEEYKTNAKSDEYPNGRWKINHEYKYFANNQGQSAESGVPTPDLNFNFDKPGKYNILFDDKLVKEVYVHRKPVADFTIEIGENNTLNLTSTSYDLDSNEDNSYGTGIAKENWYYKEASASEWTEGKLTEFDKTKIYMIKLEVEDYQGATSYTTKYTGTGNPVSNFNYANNVVSKYKPLVVNNTSYDPEGYDIVEQVWELKKDGKVVSTTSEPITDFNVDGLGEGNYTYTLTVKNNLGTVSEAFSKSFTIEEDYGKPEVAIGQQGCDWKTSQAISLEFSDNESEFKNWRYAFTTSPVAPATDEEWSAWSEETTPTVELSGVSGKYYLHIQAYDVASNELTRAVGTYNLDNTEPVINDVKTQKDEINKMFIKVEATDEHSGIVGYAITKAEPMTFNLRTRVTATEPTDYQESNILEVTDNGTYNVWVKDSTGNVTVTTYTVEDVNYIGKNTTVYAEVGCEFKVTIPKHIILSGSTKSGNYTVGVEGDIAGTDVIKVVPDESFALSSTNLNDVTATIEQDKTEWSYDQILNDEFKVIGNGTIDASGISAGSWNGNFNFNIALEGDKIYKNSEPFVEYMDILYNYEIEETN